MLPDKYKLHFAGAFQEKRYELYLKHMVKEMQLEDVVEFCGHVEDMNSFWNDKRFLLNTSIHEGHNVAILEAMSRGITPIVHNFIGAKELYDYGFTFNTTNEAAYMIGILGGFDNQKDILKLFAEKDWTKKNQIEKIKGVLGV